MSQISVDRLPAPYSPGNAWPPQPAAAAGFGPSAGNSGGQRRGGGRVAAIVGCAVALLAIGGLVVHVATGDDDTNVSTRPDATESDTETSGTETSDTDDGTTNDEGSNDAALSSIELAAAYVSIFGVEGSQTTIDCVSDELGGNGSEALRLTSGESLNVDEATAAFVPFVTCAPDDDFLALMVPGTVRVLGGQADETCISQILVGFGIEGRAQARALAYAATDQFVDGVYATFSSCAI